MWNSKRGELSLLWNDWRQTESTLSYWRICSFVKCQFIGCLRIASQRKSICKIDSKKAFCFVLHESFFQFCCSIFNKLVSFRSSSESPDYFNNFVFFFLVVALNNALINSWTEQWFMNRKHVLAFIIILTANSPLLATCKHHMSLHVRVWIQPEVKPMDGLEKNFD